MRRFRLNRFGTTKIFELAKKNLNNSDFLSKIQNKYVIERIINKFVTNNSEDALNDLKKILIKRKNFLVLEGKILIKEALKADCIRVERIFYSNENFVGEQIKVKNEIVCHKISEDLMNLISNVKTNQGILEICPEKIKTNNLFKIILDRVSDPGNMGSIIRTAASIGCEEILVLRGSVDPWSSKVLRSAMGGHFFVKITKNITLNDITSMISKDYKILVADAKTAQNCIDYTDLFQYLNSLDKVCLIIGNEADGVNNYFYKLKSQGYKVLPVNISVQMDSLNCSIAFAVLAFEIRKILIKK